MTPEEKKAKQLQEQKKWSEVFASLWATDSLPPRMREWKIAFQEVLDKQQKQLQVQSNLEVWKTAFQSVVRSWNVNPADVLTQVIQQNPIPIPVIHPNCQKQQASGNLYRKTKPDWLGIKTTLEANNIKCFYHFTDSSNLTSIRQNGGLYSWYACEKKGITIPHPGGDPSSRMLDSRSNLQDYVRLSFCDDHPMAYRHKQDGADLVLLKISTDVAYQEATLFSNMNATANGHSVGGALADLKKIDFSAVKKHFVSRADPKFALHQAECMVRTFVPMKYILNIDNPDKM